MKKLYEESSVQKIADTIREIIKTAFTYKISEMPDGIKDVYLKGVEDGSVSGGVQVKSGTVTLDEGGESFVINTGLTRVDAIMIERTASLSSAATFFWAYGANGDISISGTGYRTQYLTNFAMSSKVTIDGGDVTCNRYSTDYPIASGNYKWIAYGE